MLLRIWTMFYKVHNLKLDVFFCSFVSFSLCLFKHARVVVNMDYVL